MNIKVKYLRPSVKSSVLSQLRKSEDCKITTVWIINSP